MAEARRSAHSFGSTDAENAVLIDRFNITLGTSSLQSYVV